MALFGLGQIHDAVAEPPSLSRDMIPEDMPAEVRTQVEQLYSSHPAVYVRATAALGAMGPKAASAAPFLASMLEGHYGDDGPNTAGHALIKIGKGAVESLNLALSATGSAARRRAAYILGVIGDERSIEPLLDSFASRLGGAAELGALRRIGEPARRFVFDALKSENAVTRRAAVRAIVAFSAIGIGHRFLANDQGGEIPVPTGWHSQPVVDALLGVLADDDRDVRIGALESLRVLASTLPTDVRLPLSDSLRAIVADPNPDVRLAALDVVSWTVGDGKIELLATLISDSDRRIRDATLQQLTRLRDDRSLDLIAGAAKSADKDLRPVAVAALASSAKQRFIPLLLELTNDRDQVVRKEAVTGLGKLRAPESEQLLLKLLSEDPAMPVRVAAIAALGRCGENAAADALIGLCDSEDPQLRWEAAYALYDRCMETRGGTYALSPFPGAGWRDATLRRYDREQSQWLPLPKSLHGVFPVERVREAMTGVLKGPNHDLHALAAAVLIGLSGASPSDRVLLAALNSPEEIAWGFALEYLSRSGTAPGREFRDAVQRLASRDQDWRALVLLGRMGDTKTVIEHCDRILSRGGKGTGSSIMALVSLGGQGMDVLLKHLGNRSSQTRTDVAMTLSEHMGDPRVKAFVASALASENANLQDGARRVIARTSVATGGRETDTPKILATVWRQNVSDPQEPARRKLLALGAAATPTVLALLKDENSAVRVAAVEMLAEIGDRSAVPSLVKTLGDDSVAVRAGAVEALGRLGDPKSASALVKVIGDRNPAVGEVALNALSILDAPVATEALIGAMSSDDWRLRRAAAEGLGRRANDRAAAALIRVVEKDPQWSVRRAAADSLGRTGNIACAPALIAALGDNHWFVRYAAHQSLQALAGRESAADPDAWNTWWEQNRKRRSAQ